MGWADHEPPGGWDAPRPKHVPGGIEVGHMFFPWENFDVVPAGKLRRAEKERDGLREKAKKAQKEAAEADRLSRLAKFKQMATGPDVSRWFLIDGEWRWHSWDPGQRKLVDTGLRPGKHGTGFPPDEVTVCRHCGAYE